MSEDKEFGEGNSLGWYIGYHVVSPLLLAAELGMRLRFSWNEWRARR